MEQRCFDARLFRLPERARGAASCFRIRVFQAQNEPIHPRGLRVHRDDASHEFTETAPCRRRRGIEACRRGCDGSASDAGERTLRVFRDVFVFARE